MKKEALAHFKKVDPVLYGAARKVGHLREFSPRPPGEYFSRLAREIITQQLSLASGGAILKRFYSLLDGKQPTPRAVARLSEQELRETGMSYAKARYLRGLAFGLEAKELRLSHLSNLSDEQAIEELTKIKGVGQWTAEMFLMFALGREDVFSFGDVGLQRGFEKVYGGEFSRERAEPVVAEWSPWRTWGARVLWVAREGKEADDSSVADELT